MRHKTLWCAGILLAALLSAAAQAQTYDLREMYRENQTVRAKAEMSFEFRFTPDPQEGAPAPTEVVISMASKNTVRYLILTVENGDPRTLRAVPESGEEISVEPGADPVRTQCPYIGKVIHITRSPDEPNAYSDEGDAAIEDEGVGQWVDLVPSDLFPPKLERLAAVSVGDRWEVPAKSEEDQPAKACLVGVTEEDGRRVARIELELPGDPGEEGGAPPLKGTCLFDLDAHRPASIEIGGEDSDKVEGAEGVPGGTQGLKARIKLVLEAVEE